MLKKSLILLTVLSFAVVAHGALAPGVEMLPSGDMEDGGDATTPPLYWSEVGPGTIGVSGDVPPGGDLQSLFVDGDSGLGSYSHDYTDQSGYAAGTQIQISYWHKGDLYTSIGMQSGYTLISGQEPWDWFEGVTEWTYREGVIQIDGYNDGFSFLVYDNTDGGMTAMIDNVSFKVIPEPATMTLIGLGGLALIRRRK